MLLESKELLLLCQVPLIYRKKMYIHIFFYFSFQKDSTALSLGKNRLIRIKLTHHLRAAGKNE